MLKDGYREDKEYNHKNTIETYYKLEELTMRLFELWHFEKVGRQELSVNFPVDFVVSKGNRIFFVILKYFRNLRVSSYNLRFVYKKLQELESKKDKDNSNSLVLIYGLVSDKFRNDVKKKYRATTLDLSNLLYMAAIDEKIESEIKALLDFSVTDVVTVAPVGLNLNKRLLEDKQLGFEYEKDSEKLIRRLSDWIPKNNDYTRYESLCVDVLKYLFDDELALWKVQERTYDNLYRFDLICRIKDGSVSGFWKTIEQFFNSKYVVFEFKNYREQITQREIYTTEKYLYLKALRGVAIIISCHGTDNNAEKRLEDH